jgi:hypothetical protein
MFDEQIFIAPAVHFQLWQGEDIVLPLRKQTIQLYIHMQIKFLPLKTSWKGSSRKWLFAACLSTLLAGSHAFAQTLEEPTWTFIQEVNKVKFYYQQSECNGHPFLLLRVVNDNASEVRGHWRLNIQDGERKFESIGMLMGMTASVTKDGNCNKPEPDLMVPFKLSGTTAPKFTVEASISAL